MHDHNNNGRNGGHKGVMWMMILCLLLLGVLFLVLDGGKLSSSGYLWPILIGAFMVAHVWMMFRGHGGHRDADTEEKSDAALEKQLDAKNEHKHGGCCH